MALTTGQNCVDFAASFWHRDCVRGVSLAAFTERYQKWCKRHLNANYLESLTTGHPDEIIARTVDLTVLNGSKEYGTCECKVAPLTLDELRKYHGILPKPETWEWSVTPWSTPAVDEDDTWVLGLNSDGGIGYGYCSSTYGSRPAFLIPSSFAVEDGNSPLEQYSARELAEELFRRIEN